MLIMFLLMEGVLVDVKSLSFRFPHLVGLPRTPQEKAVHWADQLPRSGVNLNKNWTSGPTLFPTMRQKHPQPLDESWNKKQISLGLIHKGPWDLF